MWALVPYARSWRRWQRGANWGWAWDQAEGQGVDAYERSLRWQSSSR